MVGLSTRTPSRTRPIGVGSYERFTSYDNECDCDEERATGRYTFGVGTSGLTVLKESQAAAALRCWLQVVVTDGRHLTLLCC